VTTICGAQSAATSIIRIDLISLPLGLRCKMVWRSLASSVGYGPVAMVIIIVVVMFADIALPGGS
jgi:hypothetical protein